MKKFEEALNELIDAYYDPTANLSELRAEIISALELKLMLLQEEQET